MEPFNYHNLLEELMIEIINKMDTNDLVNLCLSSNKISKFCHSIVVSKLNNSINIANFTFIQLLNYLKITMIKSNFSAYDNIHSYYNNAELTVYNKLVNFYLDSTIDKKFYQVIHIGYTYIFLTYQGEVGIRHVFDDENIFMIDNIMHITTDSDGIYAIDRNGECYEFREPYDFIKIEGVKRIVQKAGQFFLTMDGNVYIKTINHKIKNPYTNKTVNIWVN